MKTCIARIVLAALLLFPSVCLAGPALDTVKTNVTSVIEILRDPGLKGEKGQKIKRERIGAAASRLFDFVELSKRTLGLNWNKFTPEQRQSFVRLYRTLLEDTYMERITAYSGEKINYVKEVPLSDTTVEVQSTVAAKGGDAAINYRLINKDGQWRVYDVVVEGVSLIANYRSQFREILGNGKPQDLIDSLEKKAGKRG